MSEWFTGLQWIEDRINVVWRSIRTFHGSKSVILTWSIWQVPNKRYNNSAACALHGKCHSCWLEDCKIITSRLKSRWNCNCKENHWNQKSFHKHWICYFSVVVLYIYSDIFSKWTFSWYHGLLTYQLIKHFVCLSHLLNFLIIIVWKAPQLQASSDSIRSWW